MKPDFADALSKLLGEYADAPIDDVISELEIQLYALREQEAASATDDEEEA